MWDELIEKKAEWIGGDFIEQDHDLGEEIRGKLLDIYWEPVSETFPQSEKTPAGKTYLHFRGQGDDGEPMDYICTREILALDPRRCPENGLAFSHYYGSTIILTKP